MRFLSFKSRLRMFLVVFAIVPLIIIGWNSYRSIYHERAMQRELDIKTEYAYQARALENYLESLESELLNIINTTMYFDTEARLGLKTYLSQLNGQSVQNLKPFVVAIKEGQVLYLVSKSSLQAETYSNLDPVDTYASSFLYNNENQVITMTVNRLTENGTQIIAGVDVPIYLLDTLLNRKSETSLVEWTLWDSGDFAGGNTDNRFLNKMPTSLTGSELTIDAGDENRSYYFTRIMGGKLSLGISSTSMQDDRILAAIKMKYFVIVMILIGLSATLSIVYANQMYNPVRVIDRRSTKLLEGSLSTRITIWYSGIFRPIVEGFNSLAQKSEKDYNELLQQSMEMIRTQDSLLEVNQSLERNYQEVKNANRRLEYSKEKFRTLIANIHDLVWVIDENFKIVFVNEAFETKLGRSASALLGQDFKALLAEETQPDIEEKLMASICEQDIEALHIWFKKQSDDEAEILMTNTVRIFKNGKFAGVQGISRPLSENWLLTQKLTRRSQALEDIRDITRSLATENSQDALFDLILKKIYELYDVIICSIRVINDEGHLELVDVTGPGSHVLTDVAISNKEDIRFKVLEDNKMIYLEELEPGHLQNYSDVEKASETAQSLVVLPLAGGNEKIGVVSVAFSEKLPQNELMILSTIGIQSTLAIKKAQLYEKQREEFLGTIKVLVTAIEAKDAYTEGHSMRVSEFATLVATEMGLSSQIIEDIQFAGLLHDIGKIGIDDFILTKKGRLSPFESDKIKEHPEIGLRILQPIGFSKIITDGVMLHHKRYDLTGYPHDEIIEELPLSAAIIGVSDALDAMTSKRSYSEGRPLDEAIEEIIKHRKTQFAPQVVDSILRIYERSPETLERIIAGKVQVMS